MDVEVLPEYTNKIESTQVEDRDKFEENYNSRIDDRIFVWIKDAFILHKFTIDDFKIEGIIKIERAMPGWFF